MLLSDSAEVTMTNEETPDGQSREVRDTLAQILYSIGLALHSAQRALVENPQRLQELLEFIGHQSEAGLNQLPGLRGDEP